MKESKLDRTPIEINKSLQLFSEFLSVFSGVLYRIFDRLVAVIPVLP
jgi:hypothetical protein